MSDPKPARTPSPHPSTAMTAVDSDTVHDHSKISKSPRQSPVLDPEAGRPSVDFEQQPGQGQERGQPPPPTTPYMNAEMNQTNYDFYANAPPSLSYVVTPGRRRMIAIWGILFFIEAGVLPLVLFYGIRWGTHLSMTTNLAIITSVIGTVSGLKMTQRSWYLWIAKGHEHRRPIGAGRWGVDCIHVLAGLAMFAFFTPLIIGSSLSPAQPRAVAMALPCVMITLGLPLLITGLFPNQIRMPFRVSSLPHGRPLPPLVYMYVEDVVSVDGGGGHDFRQAWRTRYEESRVMRRIVRDASVYWGFTGVAIGASLIGIDWSVTVDPGYGISYGLPWAWSSISFALTYFFVRHMLKVEKREWVAPEVHKERILPIKEGKYDRPSLDQARRMSTMVPRRAGEPHDLEALGEEPRMLTTESPVAQAAPTPPMPTHPPLREKRLSA